MVKQIERGSTKWLRHTPGQRDHYRLFCFPYAGGGASIFSDWSHYMDERIAIYPVQLPGRENRAGEEPYKNISQLVEDVGKDLQPYLDKPFAFFGHSLGALIAYEVTKKMEQEMTAPDHLFISARTSPHVEKRKTTSYQLPEGEFIKELERLNGTHKEVLNNKELMKVLLPFIRADFQLFETYEYKPGRPLSTRMTVFGGTKDEEVDGEKLNAWKDLLNHQDFHLHMLEGGHFFLHEDEKKEAMADVISQTLLEYSQ